MPKLVPSLSLPPRSCRTSKHQQLGLCLRPLCPHRSPLCPRLGCPGTPGNSRPQKQPSADDPAAPSWLRRKAPEIHVLSRFPELPGIRLQLSRTVTGSVMQPYVSFFPCFTSLCPTGVSWDQLPRTLHLSPWVETARPGFHSRHCCLLAVQLRASSPVPKPQFPREYDRDDNIYVAVLFGECNCTKQCV